jgi:hypothetical protein
MTIDPQTSAKGARRARPPVRKPSGAVIVAMVALFSALGGVAVAGDGDPILLGRPNTADQQTSLTANNVPNPTLRVENTSTDGNARGVVGLISSPAASAGSAGVVGATAATDPGSAGVVAQNTGSGPALKALVNSGAAPFTVNSSAKVANLNADRLDGMRSNGFIQGKGSTQFARLLLPQFDFQDNFFVLPGIGGFYVACSPESIVQTTIEFTVSDGIEGTITRMSDTMGNRVDTLTPGFTYPQDTLPGGPPAIVKMHVWTSDGKRNARVWLSLVNQGTSCLYGASAIVQSS